jgi:hypothetical protein
VSKRIFSAVALFAFMAATQTRQSFTGIITDNMCAEGDHSVMKMGSNDVECIHACVEDHVAAYVLYDGKEAYFLDDQKTPEKFAGKRAVVTGVIDAAKKTIHVETIALASGSH